MIKTIFLIIKAYCLKELLTKDNNFGIVSYVESSGNTVNYITMNCLIIGDEFVALDNSNIQANLEIVNENTNKVIYSGTKPVNNSNFFFTAPVLGKYRVTSSLTNIENYDEQFAIEVNIHVGREGSTNIISFGEVEVSRAGTIIESIFQFIYRNFFIHKSGYEDEMIYKSLYDVIFFRVIIMIVLKITVALCTLIYSNKMTKQYFTQQKIGE
ncbi:hypothetical protein A0H76_1833 [Hepatospora eriocheir]|uniref:GOLD domain-containing protein n=1 Tax=Hepatospora eriocheir TaxID=1081669 RepID=A0A1X0QBF9_9MICR|nr:hypothetical protein HERIO_1061 [Hepatospora eriocheir]ORD98854.1 hypothetical protein A0H76_1833 [Hepatospora eriocheir]